MSVSSLPSAASGSSNRSTPISTSSTQLSQGVVPYKTLSPSGSLIALSKLGDDEIKSKKPEELLRIIRRMEAESRAFVAEHAAIIKDVNRRIHINAMETRGLKEINQKLQDDNQELRDLCCFLDDDRQHSRKLAREWQRFGRYTSSVMRSEVSNYQEKLADLERKQEELVSENSELKELCLFLDQERLRYNTNLRDDGDGSSNSTTAGLEDNGLINGLPGSDSVTPTEQRPVQDSRQYIQQLEEQVRQLEEEKKTLAQKSERNVGDGYRPPADRKPHNRSDTRSAPVGNNNESMGGRKSITPTPRGDNSSPSKPEAVVHAMKVLEVHENLEKPRVDSTGNNLDDKEKAIVREMCNVVWRKLGDTNPEGGSSNFYENIPARQPAQQPPPQQPRSISQPSFSHQRVLSPPPNRRPDRYHGNNHQSQHSHQAYNQRYPSTSTSLGHLNQYHDDLTGGTDLVPGITQTVHSQNLPSHQQYRSPPPPPINHNSSRAPPPPPNYHFNERSPPPPSQQNYENIPPPLPQKPKPVGQGYNDRPQRSDRISTSSYTDHRKPADMREMTHNYNKRSRPDQREMNYRPHQIPRDNSRERILDSAPSTSRSWDQERRTTDYDQRNLRQNHPPFDSYH